MSVLRVSFWEARASESVMVDRAEVRVARARGRRDLKSILPEEELYNYWGKRSLRNEDEEKQNLNKNT